MWWSLSSIHDESWRLAINRRVLLFRAVLGGRTLYLSENDQLTHVLEARACSGGGRRRNWRTTAVCFRKRQLLAARRNAKIILASKL